MEGIEVTPAAEQDVATVRALTAEWAREGSTIGQGPSTEAYLLSFLSECSLVARVSGRIVGFACARIANKPGYAVTPADRRVLQIEELYVCPEARRQGIGSALVRTVLQWARDRGVAAFHVFTATRDTDRILRFYRRLGFEPWGIQMYRSERTPGTDPHTAL
ncbi:MAG: GNAT family N-acetyltransferase [Spirochaetaceae bacterium]|nr:GNAT family N-acetyltransferase [Spirochaetaceae bacterium]